MKTRFNLSALFVLLVLASAPARADMLTAFLVDASSRLLSAAGRAVVSTVKEAVVPKESAEDRKVRENLEIEKAAEQILSQYSAEQRDAMRPEVMNRLTLVYAQFNTMEARQKAIADEQNSFGNTVLNATVGSVTNAVGNHMAIDSAARAAFFRTRF